MPDFFQLQNYHTPAYKKIIYSKSRLGQIYFLFLWPTLCSWKVLNVILLLNLPDIPQPNASDSIHTRIHRQHFAKANEYGKNEVGNKNNLNTLK